MVPRETLLQKLRSDSPSTPDPIQARRDEDSFEDSRASAIAKNVRTEYERLIRDGFDPETALMLAEHRIAARLPGSYEDNKARVSGLSLGIDLETKLKADKERQALEAAAQKRGPDPTLARGHDADPASSISATHDELGAVKLPLRQTAPPNSPVSDPQALGAPTPKPQPQTPDGGVGALGGLGGVKSIGESAKAPLPQIAPNLGSFLTGLQNLATNYLTPKGSPTKLKSVIASDEEKATEN